MMDWLKKLAPTLATAIGGPLGGLAVEALGKAFGWEDATETKVKDFLTRGQLSGEDLAKLQLAELDLVKLEKELGFKFAELEARDRQAEHAEQQNTIRNGDNAEDPYVRQTRPKMARQSWYGMALYILVMEGLRAAKVTEIATSVELAMILGSPALAYIGFRSVFDKFGLMAKFAKGGK